MYAVLAGKGQNNSSAHDDPSVDVLAIAAPDHWHAPATIMACAAGKHVYVEKPASHNGHEGQMMLAAARNHQRVVQLGMQRRSSPGTIEAIGRLRAGEVYRLSANVPELPSKAVLDLMAILQRMPQDAQRDFLLAHAGRVLRARLHLQGSVLAFANERMDHWWWQMTTPNANAVRLVSVLIDNPEWQADMPRLARAVLHPLAGPPQA